MWISEPFDLKKITCLALLSIIIMPALSGHGISESDRQAMLSGGIPEYIWLGASHMLTGYDHLLFIFGIIFFLNSFKDIFKYITIFTLGHSITLLVATFMKITANSYLIDAIIALSVCYKGFENIGGFKKYLDVSPPHLSGMIFSFGLIHGFGLSTRLQQLPIEGPRFLYKILSFNLGVEVGQILALIVMMTIMNSWKKTQSFKKFAAASNYFLIAAGLLLFLMQTHGYLHTTYPDDFGFSDDLHQHAHDHMTPETQNHHDSL